MCFSLRDVSQASSAEAGVTVVRELDAGDTFSPSVLSPASPGGSPSRCNGEPNTTGSDRTKPVAVRGGSHWRLARSCGA